MFLSRLTRMELTFFGNFRFQLYFLLVFHLFADKSDAPFSQQIPKHLDAPFQRKTNMRLTMTH